MPYPPGEAMKRSAVFGHHSGMCRRRGHEQVSAFGYHEKELLTAAPVGMRLPDPFPIGSFHFIGAVDGGKTENLPSATPIHGPDSTAIVCFGHVWSLARGARSPRRHL
jgi:hypothetical protein